MIIFVCKVTLVIVLITLLNRNFINLSYSSSLSDPKILIEQRTM